MTKKYTINLSVDYNTNVNSDLPHTYPLLILKRTCTPNLRIVLCYPQMTSIKPTEPLINQKVNKRKLETSALGQLPKRRKFATKPASGQPSSTTKFLNAAKRDGISRKKTEKHYRQEVKVDNRDDERFGIKEHDRKMTKIKTYERDLMGFCVLAQSLCANEGAPLTKRSEKANCHHNNHSEPGPNTMGLSCHSAGRSLYEKHLCAALHHIREAAHLKTFDVGVLREETNNQTDTMGKVGSYCKALESQLIKTTAKYNGLNASCRKAVDTVTKVRTFMDEWERWKVQYVSELRIQYDPTLCGGVSKPTLDVLSAQSGASKLRLSAIKSLSQQKADVINKMKSLSPSTMSNLHQQGKEQNLEECQLANQLLQCVGSSTELSRNETESHFLNVVENLSKFEVSKQHEELLVLSSMVRMHHQLNVCRADATLLQQSDSNQSTNTSKSSTVSHNMPDLLKRFQKTEPVSQDIEPLHSNVNIDRLGGSRLKTVFGSNSVSKVTVRWDRDTHNTPLEEVNWASKTTTRGIPGTV